MPRQKKYNTEEERKEAKRLAKARYRKSEKGKQENKRYLKVVSQHLEIH